MKSNVFLQGLGGTMWVSRELIKWNGSTSAFSSLDPMQLQTRPEQTVVGLGENPLLSECVFQQNIQNLDHLYRKDSADLATGGLNGLTDFTTGGKEELPTGHAQTPISGKKLTCETGPNYPLKQKLVAAPAPPQNQLAAMLLPWQPVQSGAADCAGWGGGGCNNSRSEARRRTRTGGGGSGAITQQGNSHDQPFCYPYLRSVLHYRWR